MLSIVSVRLLPALASVNAGPAVWVWLTKNSRDGSRSERITCAAGSPPLFRTVIVYWMLFPAMIAGGPALATATSAGVSAVVVAVAVLLICALFAVAALTRPVSVNVAVAPGGNAKPSGGPEAWVSETNATLA